MTDQVVYQQCSAVVSGYVSWHNTNWTEMFSEIAETPKVTYLPKCITPFTLRKPASWFRIMHMNSVLPKPQAKWLP